MDGQNVDDNHSGINISDVIEVIETDTDFITMRPRRPSGEGSSSAFVRITEQPASKTLRFRYECEGRSAGSLPGINSTPELKTYPSIEIIGYKGPFAVIVSCVTKDIPYKPHPHNLVGKEGCKDGVYSCKKTDGDNMTVTFANLGIQCVKKKDISDALKVREKLRVDPFRTGFAHKSQTSGIDLNSVRLCFQAFLEGPEKGKFTVPLPPVVSEPIYDKKAVADLVIYKLSHSSASAAGDQNVILLCEKVAKEDISIRFFEEKDGDIVWEGYGEFTPSEVHKQTAISFRTPRYRSIEIDDTVKASIQLKRPSDGATSDATTFYFTPLSDTTKRKRLRNDHEINFAELEQMNLVTTNGNISVKREPGTSVSPNPYLLTAPQSVSRNPSPVYTSRTPSPLYMQSYNMQGAAGVFPIPSVPASAYSQYLNINQRHQQFQTTEATNIYDMDTQQLSLEFLADVEDGNNLSSSLSATLSLSEQNQQATNSTDSLSGLAIAAYNNLFKAC